MEKIKMTPYAMFLRKDEFKKILPKKLAKRLIGEENDLYGVVIDIKAFDKIDNPKIFLEYTFGESSRKKIFFDVDTQKDFMNVDGALYVPNAESIKTNLAKLTEFGDKNKILRICSVDTHYGSKKYKKVETELQRWAGPFPDHCMVNTEGWEGIEETNSEPNLTICIQKQTYDVFSNPVTKQELKNVEEAVVYGVATDYCVKAAVLGMLKMGIKVTVVKDAIMGVAKDTTTEAIKEMKEKGAAFKTTDEIIE